MNLNLFKVLAFAGFAGTLLSAQESESVNVVSPSREIPLYTTTREMKNDTIITSLYLERLHITHKKIEDVDKREFLERYVGTLDGSRMIFLEEDVRLFQERFASMLDNNFKNGNIYPAFEIYKVFLEKYAARVAWIRNELTTAKFDLRQGGTFTLDRKKLPWPKDAAAADRLWRERLCNDLINELLSGKETLDDAAVAAAAERVASRYEKIAKNIVLEPWEVEEIFLNALTSEFDPHTTFFTAQSMADFQIAMRNALCGIGAVLYDDDGYCTIREIMPGGPVERSGQFEVGDRLIAVGTKQGSDEMVDVIGMRLNRIVHMLRGKKGEKVRLYVESGSDHSRRRVIVLERDEIKIAEQLASAKLISVPAGEKSVPVGVINLPGFYGRDSDDALAFSTTDDVRELLEKLKKLGARAIILDLRQNGGGYLNEAINLTELFVGANQPVVRIKDAAGTVVTYKTGQSSLLSAAGNLLIQTPASWDGPMIILTSKASASASEIVAGALSDNGRALIVGDPQTHGKGSVQEVKPYSLIGKDYNASIKVTRSKWYAPSGNSIQLNGVPADIAIPSTYSVLPVAESDLENPLPWDSVESALPKNPQKYAWLKAPISQELIDRLAESSKRRQAELPEFQTLTHSLAWFKDRQDDKSVCLNIDKRLETREADMELYAHIKETLAAYEAKDAFPCKEIKLESALAKEKTESESAAGTKKAKKKSSADRINIALTIPGVNPKTADKEDNALLDNEDDLPDFDIVLREAARIAADWVGSLEK
ncbi:MAG: carboxy terminal-processing peptidase [Opitutales bacterium]|nr:carboxy terminal-processing peptidase [Opitutales bacterium]